MCNARTPLEYGILFTVGGAVYVLVELLWRGYSHWSMYLLGGLCFLLIGGINERCPWDMPLVSQMVLSALMVTGAELAAGYLLNILLRMGIWDYSSLPYNLCGQVCLLYSVLWFLLSPAAILLDDFLRYLLFKEEKPHYRIF